MEGSGLTKLEGWGGYKFPDSCSTYYTEGLGQLTLG